MMTPRSPPIGSAFTIPGARAQYAEGADQVDADDAGELVQRVHAVLAQHTDGIAGSGAVDDDRTGPRGLGEVECLGDALPSAVTWRRRSARARRAPLATSSPADDGRSRMTTLAPLVEQRFGGQSNRRLHR